MNRPFWQYAFACALVLPASIVVGQADEGTPAREVARARRQGSTDPRMQLRLLERFQGELKRTISLDDAQIEEVDAIFTDQLAAMREELGSSDGGADDSERLRELVEQLRAAQEEGDREAANAAREEIRAMRMVKGEGKSLDYEPLLDDIRAVLDEEQMDNFEKLASRLETRLRGGQKDATDGITLYRQALRGLQLTTEQRRATREIVAEAMRDWRQAEAEERTEIEEEVGELILDELDEEQATQFETNLERLKKAQAVARKPGLADRRVRRAVARDAEADQPLEHDEHADQDDAEVEPADEDSGDDE